MTISKYAVRVLQMFLATASLSVFEVNAAESEPSIANWARSELEYNIAKYDRDTELLEIRNSYREARIAHQKSLMDIAERAYNTQHIMTIAIFFIVSILVLGGFYLSYLQFRHDTTSDGEEKVNHTRFKIGKTGVEFSSSVIGLVVLFMSFMFFHLYVKDVYSIKTHKVSAVSFDHTESKSLK